ncbi:hypothetical protein AB0O28_09400 [Microbispora sp. NPDC088329]|uniref:alpha/beta fold hydrolase n=1 Tax=Microbispora sp. NPDC088329 TaxID=3154869 RepID=UPI003441C86A
MGSQWEPLGERFRVIRLDFRGHGRTPFVAEGPYSDAGDVADLLELDWAGHLPSLERPAEITRLLIEFLS